MLRGANFEQYNPVVSDKDYRVLGCWDPPNRYWTSILPRIIPRAMLCTIETLSSVSAIETVVSAIETSQTYRTIEQFTVHFTQLLPME